MGKAYFLTFSLKSTGDKQVFSTQKLFLFSINKAFNLLFLGHVAALVRSHAIGLLPFRLTKEQTTQTMDPSPKTIELLHYPGQ